MSNLNGGREAFSWNLSFRMDRRQKLVQRLQEQFLAGNETDRVTVSTIKSFLCRSGTPLNDQELGRVIKLAFPGVSRKRSNSSWYYYGVKHICGIAKAEVSHDATPDSYQCGVTSFQDKPLSADKDCSNQESGKDHDVAAATNNVSYIQQDAFEKESVIKCPSGFRKPTVNARQYRIPSLNLCRGDMSDLAKGNLIGEGTFGKCISGTYKGIPAAFKIFKDVHHCEDVHAEADILLQIPGHPGISMLVGVFTTDAPFILATKLCTSAGKTETYASFLTQQQSQGQPNLRLALHLLQSIGDALIHIHSVGILHNDLKGNNVVLEDTHGKKKAVLIDFGKACQIIKATESLRHKLMNDSERQTYRERYPHMAPELSFGTKPTVASDVYSYGYMYCMTMKIMKEFLGDQRKFLLELGKKLSHFKPQKRPSIKDAITEIGGFIN